MRNTIKKNIYLARDQIEEAQILLTMGIVAFIWGEKDKRALSPHE